jgi:hypothetical protein
MQIVIFYGTFFVMSFLCLGMHFFFCPSLWFTLTQGVTQQVMFTLLCALCEK